jgi:tRNA (guanine-N7-)-methyltransferase
MVVGWRTTSLHCRSALFKSLLHPNSPWLRRYSSKAMPVLQATDTSSETFEKQTYAAAKAPPKRPPHWDQVPQNKYTELGIDKSLYDKAGGARFRQHVNPLKRELQVPAEPLDWSSAFTDPSLPLILDVGCGYGRFLLAFVNNVPGYNALGLEIREPVVDRANRWAENLELQRKVRFVLANATVSVENMLKTFPGPLSLVTIQFPDPHFKRRHHKRRVVQPQLVSAIKALVPQGGRVFLQSDVLEVAENMRDQFEKEAGTEFELSELHNEPEAVFHQASEVEEPKEGEVVAEMFDSTWAQGGWLKENPLPVPTERELHVLNQNLPVYRIMLVKK